MKDSDLTTSIFTGKYFLLIVFLCLVASLSYGQGSSKNKTRPNILFIAVDDLRPELGAYGKTYMITPAIDKLAKEGRVFLNHYVNVPTCGASRYSMLTGRYPQSLQALSNSAFEKLSAGQPEKEIPESFIALFRRNGYETKGVGKISHAPDGRIYGYNQPVSDTWELPHSWDQFLFNAGKWQTGWNAFFGYASGENRQSLKNSAAPYEMKDVDDSSYPDGLTAAIAIEQLSQLKKSKKPFLLAVGFFKPHLPFTAPKKYWDLYKEADLPLTNTPDIPAMTSRRSFHNSDEFNQYNNGLDRPSLSHPVNDTVARRLRHAYFAAVSYVDAQIGKVLDALQENGLDKNTIIVLWGDHGWHLGDDRVWGKHTLSEYALHSPLIIKVPGMPVQGSTTNTIVQSVDIYPTLLQLAGIKQIGILDGRSLYPQLRNPSAISNNIAYAYFNRGITLRTTRYRLTKYYRKETPLVELYDYQKDPYESRNIADQQRGVVDSLQPFINNKKTNIQQFWNK